MSTLNRDENTTHAGDGVYATFDGFGIEIRVNDHRNPPVVYLEPQVLNDLKAFLDRKRETMAIHRKLQAP